MDHEALGKIIHDINSQISAIGQSIDLIKDKMAIDPALTEKVVVLTKEKVEALEKSWEILKDNIT